MGQEGGEKWTAAADLQPTIPKSDRLLALVAAALAALLPGLPCGAQTNVDPVRLYLEQATTGLPGRVEISVGQLDERLNLAPCAQVEPYVPGNARLWGKSRIGLRCTVGASWNVFLPIEVRVFGQALVAARPIPYGQAFGTEDAQLEEVELSREAGTALSDPNSLEGKTAARAIAPGQVLRAEYFRTPPAVGAGDTVRLIYSGGGFTVSASGRALAAAADGAPVRVQTESGRVVQGIARPGRLVEMRL